ncbi:hypothetical protein Tco_0411707 [Tanacetum coccineum]
MTNLTIRQVDCFPKQVIWDVLRDIGYEGNLAQLTFSKPLFSPQWKYLVHVLLHCLSPKSTSWEQFGTNIASALVEVVLSIGSGGRTRELVPPFQGCKSARDAQGTHSQSASTFQRSASYYLDMERKSVRLKKLILRRKKLLSKEWRTRRTGFWRQLKVLLDREVARKIQAEWDAEEERKRFEELKKTKPKTTLRKPTSLAQERNQMMSFLKGQGYENLQKLKKEKQKDAYEKESSNNLKKQPSKKPKLRTETIDESRNYLKGCRLKRMAQDKRKWISDKRTKNKAKNDKTKHEMEKHGKDKVKSKSKSTPTKSKPRSPSTPIEAHKSLGKDEEGEDVDVHLYRSMIGCLMYLTASRPDIMFAVCLCARFQVTPKVSHLHAVKRIFRYLKHQPNLGLWYPKDSPFHLEAFSDSDYAGDNHDRRSTSGGCQYLGRRLVSWQCKKQTIVAISSTGSRICRAAASCCAQVLWMQNQLLDYGFNFMNTEILETMRALNCIVQNPVFTHDQAYFRFDIKSFEIAMSKGSLM